MTEASAPPPKGTRRRRGAEAQAALGHVQPKTYEELRAVLASGTVSFPPRLRQVAIFLWQHPTDVALGSIIKVARQAGVHILAAFASMRPRRIRRGDRQGGGAVSPPYR